MDGPGHDHRDRLDRLPAGVGPRAAGQAPGARRVAKVMTMTSTYDHRIIQGAESGSFLRRIDQLLQGEDEFYESVAADARASRQRSSPTRIPPPPPRRRWRSRHASPPQPPSGHRRPGRRGAAAGGAGRDLAAQGLPHPRPPRRPPQPARRRRQGRPGARAREPQPDPRADGQDPRLDPADRGRRGDAARRAAADARRLLRHDRLPDRAPLLAPAADVAAAR